MRVLFPLATGARLVLGLAGPRASSPVSAALFAEVEELARIVDIAYCVGESRLGISAPFACLSRCRDFPGFELVAAWHTGALRGDSCGYIARDRAKRRLVVAFRGTSSVANAIVDLSTVPQEYEPYPEPDGPPRPAPDGPPARRVPPCRNCTVHAGFHSSWLHTRSLILPHLRAQLAAHPHYTLTLVGHSLGGAVAALAALDLRARGYHPVVTTFGEPRIGNAGLAAYLDRRFRLDRPVPADDTRRRYRRVTHVGDPVPLLPLAEWGYAMHAGEIYIAKPHLSPDVASLRHCDGDADDRCIAGHDSTLQSHAWEKRGRVASLEHAMDGLTAEPWGVPSRHTRWEPVSAHRDYFWRLGLCVPGGDPSGGGGKSSHAREDL